MQDYLINWNAGPLGVVLRPDLGLDMPPVVAQLLPQPSVLRMSGVRAGDLLMSVNGKKTSKLGYDKVVKLLFKERLPIVLHFRVPSGSSFADGGRERAPSSSALSSVPSSGPSPVDPFGDGSARSRSRSQSRSRRGSVVLGVPEDFVDAPPPLVRAQSHPHPPQPYPHPHPHPHQLQPASPSQPKPQTRHHRSRSTESPVPGPVPGSVPSPGRDADTTPRRKSRKSRKERAAAEERRLRKQYSVVWERGSLGMSFRAFAATVDVPTVDFIGATRGQGRGMDRVCVNDVLIAVNGEKTKHLGVEKVLRWLHVVDKPVVLRFHSSSNRIPTNPVPQVANAPTLPAAPPADAAPPPHPPTRRNPPPRRHSADVVPIEDEDDEDEDEDDGEFEQLYPQPDPRDVGPDPGPDPRPSGRRASVDGPRLPPRARDGSMHAYIARAHENSASIGPGGRAPRTAGDEPEDTVGDFRRDDVPSGPGLHEFDLRVDSPLRPEDVEDEIRLRLARGRGQHQRQRQHQQQHQQQYQQDQQQQYQQDQQQRQHQHQHHHQYQYQHQYQHEHEREREREHEHEHQRVAFRDAPRTVGPAIPPPPESPPSHASSARVGWSVGPFADPFADPSHDPSPGPPRKASLSASELTLRAAIEVVARASGRPADQCEFAGEPLTRIQDGSVQAKLLVVYARTCLAKEQAARAAAGATGDGLVVPEEPPSRPPVTGNPLGRKGSHQHFLSYSIPTDGRPQPTSQSQSQPQSQPQSQSQPPPLETESSGEAPRAPYVPRYTSGSDDMIALQDFELQQDGSLAERRTASSARSSSVGSKAAAAAAAAAAADESASRSSYASSGRRATSKVVSAGPLSDGEGVSMRDLEAPTPMPTPTPTPELTASSVGSSLALSLSDGGAQPDMTTLDDLIALPTPAEESKERVEASAEALPSAEPSAMEDARVATLFASVPDVHGLLDGKRPSAVLTKKEMIDEIQEILDSLQMESQFERHSHMGVGTMESPPPARGPLDDAAHAPTMDAAHTCCQCGKRSDGLADMAQGGGEWYCQDCWEFFFFSEEREEEPSPSISGERGSELDVEAASVDDEEEEAFKYSFHDSAFGRDDVLMMRLARPSPGSEPRDSALTTASSATERGDEVWL